MVSLGSHVYQGALWRWHLHLFVFLWKDPEDSLGLTECSPLLGRWVVQGILGSLTWVYLEKQVQRSELLHDQKRMNPKRPFNLGITEGGWVYISPIPQTCLMIWRWHSSIERCVEGSLFLPLEIRWILGTVWPTECGGSDATWLPELDHRR